MIVVGQATRTVAMAQAGSNFNHTVQMKKNAGHELVTRGIYAWFGHPSYFGFFWWGLGTQVVLGNTVCLVGYAGVLWKFFSSRIASTWALFLFRFPVSCVRWSAERGASACCARLADRGLGEEELLVRFFGKEYVDYRRRTWVGIPFIG